MSTGKKGVMLEKFRTQFDMDSTDGVIMETLRTVAFPQAKGKVVTDNQLFALMAVSAKYGLNPILRQIYAFPDKNGNVVPIVAVDGWISLMTSHANYGSHDFGWSDELVEIQISDKLKKQIPAWCEVIFTKKDGSITKVREYADECYVPPRKGQYGAITGPWQTHPRRMLRHKALIQGARATFGFSGIYDEDEANRIVEGTAQPVETLRDRVASFSAEKQEVADSLDQETADNLASDLILRLDSEEDIAVRIQVFNAGVGDYSGLDIVGVCSDDLRDSLVELTADNSDAKIIEGSAETVDPETGEVVSDVC